MEKGYWRGKWERNEIAFHEREANPLLVRYFEALALPEGARVFLPLCGKTLDIRWLLAERRRVAGAELSEVAVGQLFAELGVAPTITALGDIRRYSADAVDIFVGDFFALSREALGRVDAVYDRAALVALPETVRDRYAARLIEISDGAPQLLLSYEYNQHLLAGPPFSVGDEEVVRHYQASHVPALLASEEIPGGLKGRPATQKVWLLTPRGA